MGARVRAGAFLLVATAATAVACGSQPAATEATESAQAAVEAPGAAEAPAAAAGRPLPGIVRMYRESAPPPPANCQMIYHGGQVLQNASVVNVNWSSVVSAQVQTVLPQFWAAAVQSPWYAWLSEYGTAGLKGNDGLPGSNQGLTGSGTFKGSYTLSPSVCPDATKCTVTDAQVQAELAAQINAGKLPPPELGCDGFVKTIYMFEFPPNVIIDQGGGAKSCQVFCGYHESFKFTPADGGAPLSVPYGILPDMTQGPCKRGCGTNSNPIDNYTSVASHELAEAVTDTTVAFNTSTYIRPAAWGSTQCGEVGDACDGKGQGTITSGGQSFVVQAIWSNVAKACVVAQTPQPVCTGQPGQPAGCRVCGCSDVGVACSGATGFCETNPTNVDLGACVQCTATSGNCPATTSCTQSTTPATDDTCGCGGPGAVCCPGNTCLAPNKCGGGGTPGVCGCTPLKVCPGGQNCGTVPDGCGGTLACGTCTAPQTCGGGGTTGMCGCTPATTCPAGQNCSTAPDGCGGKINCGTCTSPETCGGGGTTGVCGCTPVKRCPAGADCGSIPDTCGGTVTCGPATCPAPATCGGGGKGNVCGCTPLTKCPPGDNCGSISDGCGGSINCGTCAAPQTCGGGGKSNACGCTPVNSCPASGGCGSLPDGCGGKVSCGTCSGGASCVGNVCVGPPDAGPAPDSGARDSGGAVDSGSVVDSGAIPEAGAAGPDAAGTPDASESDASGDSGAGGSTGGSGGCGCRTAQAREAGPSPALIGLGALALVAGVRSRRRRASRDATPAR